MRVEFGGLVVISNKPVKLITSTRIEFEDGSYFDSETFELVNLGTGNIRVTGSKREPSGIEIMADQIMSQRWWIPVLIIVLLIALALGLYINPQPL